jgi:hypothetical protein
MGSGRLLLCVLLLALSSSSVLSAGGLTDSRHVILNANKIPCTYTHRSRSIFFSIPQIEIHFFLYSPRYLHDVVRLTPSVAGNKRRGRSEKKGPRNIIDDLRLALPLLDESQRDILRRTVLQASDSRQQAQLKHDNDYLSDPEAILSDRFLFLCVRVVDESENL